jgi:PEP-CTERM motif
MKKFIFGLAAMFTVAVSPAMAQTVFSDTFDAENGGATALNYGTQVGSFTNFNVTGADASVDLLASGDFGINCAGGTGSCVDLDGSTNAAAGLQSINSFAFSAGDFIRLSYDLSGNQRSGADDWFSGFTFAAATSLVNFGYDYFGSTVNAGNFFTTGISVQSVGLGLLNEAPFQTRSIFFTAGNAGTLKFNIGAFGNDNVGPILDNVSLSIAPGAVPEPATWMMMILGFGLIGSAMRRRKAGATGLAAA